MIYIKRSLRAPAWSREETITFIKRDLKKFYEKPINARRQQVAPHMIIPHSLHRKIKSALSNEFKSKCAYCEQYASPETGGDFSHFRPKSTARGLSNEFSLDHYWTLAYDWRNMYYSCDQCRRYKQTWFPVRDKRASLKLKYNDLRKVEKNLLVDPCFDDPSLHFKYDAAGIIRPNSKAGSITINILKLNRKDLVARRRNVMAPIFRAFDKVEKHKGIELHIRRLANPSKDVNHIIEWVNSIVSERSSIEFLGMQRYFVRKWLQESGLFSSLIKQFGSEQLLEKLMVISFPKQISGRYVIADNFYQKPIKSKATKRLVKRVHFPKRIFIKTIEVSNFKSIEYLKVNFPSSEDGLEPWLMILGENGLGKSSFLQAVSLALMGESHLKKKKN